LRYANCGHLPGLVLKRDGTCQRLACTATVVGIFPEWQCDIGECAFSEGDTLTLYTDGITESFNSGGEDFGERRLIEALRQVRELAPQAMLESVVDQVRRFSAPEQHDDITMVIARCL
jgi:serine phosphatase RsbU (regulator of sigma subunit)